jgi:integrase
MHIKDIEDKESLIIVKIPVTKTNISRTFTITNNADEKIDYFGIYRKYAQLRPKNATSSRLFLNFRNGKCHNQVVGRNTIGSWPKKIAEYLKLENSALYTGHAFRKSSATLLANKGVDVLGLKRHGGWKSSNVAESYVEDCLQNKIEFAEKILHDETFKQKLSTSAVNNNTVSDASDFKCSSPSVVPSTSSLSNSSISITNCTFNITINK